MWGQMTEDEILAIEARVKRAITAQDDWTEVCLCAEEDIPKLIAEVRKLRAEIQNAAYERMEEDDMLADRVEAESKK